MSPLQPLLDNLSQVIVGKPDVLEHAVICLLAEGHMLLEDVPGTGKTTLAKALAQSIDCAYHRVQGTPDLMPSDITGVSVYNQKTADFEFHPGPVFTSILLADEINRATPRAQSALLEAMAERHVSVDGRSHALPALFTVLATMNPLENKGTYALPEAQMDRFLMKLSMGYPTPQHSVSMLKSQLFRTQAPTLSAVLTEAQLLELRQQTAGVRVDDRLLDYAAQLVEQTRHSSELLLGVSPRGLLAWVRAAQGRALLNRRDHVRPEDLKQLAAPVLAHRLMLSASARAAGKTSTSVLASLTDTTAVPV